MSTAYSSAKQQYIGNGVTTEWGFDFPIKKHSELKVYLKRSGMLQVLLEEGVDYSFVTENTIAFPIKTGEAKLQAADVLALQRESVFESEYNFSNQQRLEPEEVMHADDNLERQIQELKRDVTQAIRIQPTSNINTDEFFVAVDDIYENLDNINNVSGISAEIVNCSDNISDISTVSTNIANVNAVGQSISDVNTVASNVSSVNTVAGVSTDITTVAGISTDVSTAANNSANVTTVATNISDVNTAATNIEAIKNAPTAAANASQSAANAANSATISANSAIWAEGTDAQVQALGGVHSSKGWAEQSTNANISLTNSPYTTNRILEIPQDIKLELNNGTLTLKAGSKVYVPNGAGKFDEVVIDSDKSTTGVSYSKPCFVMYDHVIRAISVRDIDQCQSGKSTPGSAISDVFIYYNTSENKIYQYINNAWVAKAIAFPLCVVNMQNSAPYITSIDQVFNGFGYIGGTVFALPGVKCLVGNGRNPDGSCITKIEESTRVSIFTTTLNRQNNKIVLYNGSVGAGFNWWFDEQANIFCDDKGVNTVYKPIAILGTFSTETTSPWNIKEFNPLGVDSVLNSSLSNLSAAGQAKFDAKANVDLSNLNATGNAKFANPSLSNVNSTGKQTVVGWGMPDYSAGVSKELNTSITATRNCFVVVFSGSGTNTAGLYVNDAKIGVGGNVYATSYVCLTAYVAKGQTYRTENIETYGTYVGSVTEYPLIGG